MNFFQRKSASTATEENTILKRQVQQLTEDNKALKRTLGHVREIGEKMQKILMSSSQTSQPPPWKEDHESVAKRFEDLFEHAFIDLPSVIPDGAHTKDEVRFAFLETFESAYALCQKIIIKSFQKSLKSLTELQEDESKFSKSRDNMDKSLSLFHQAYSLLLEGSMFNEMKNPPIDSISVKQLTSNMQRLLKKAPPQAVQKKVASAIQIAWEMLTLDPPAIVCKPERYTNAWHMKIGKKWKSHQFYDLVYYRPVMLYGAGSSVAVKGKVGNKKCLDRTKCVNQEEEYSTSESDEEKDYLCATEYRYEQEIGNCKACDEPILNEKAIWHDATDTPYHFKCLMKCPFCKELVGPKEVTKAPTGALWCNQCFHKQCVCVVCNKEFNKQEMMTRQICCCHHNCNSITDLKMAYQ